MHISEVHIQGFGIFKEESVTGLSEGLNLFIGDNESGKTTLMEYIRFILFGSRGAGKDYKLVPGADHGGRMLIVTRSGMGIIVERTGRRPSLLLQGGGSPPFGSLEELLVGIDRSTFEKVFAIGLKDLQGLGIISSEGSGGWLLAAGKGLGSVPLPDVIKKIDAEKGNLLNTSSSSKKIINQILAGIKEKDAAVKKLQDQSQEYNTCRQQRTYLNERIQESSRKLDDINRRLNRIAQLNRARDKWVHLGSCEEHLAGLDFAKNFPAGGLVRFDGLKKNLEETRAKEQEKENELKKYQSQFNEITVNEACLRQQSDIEGLVSEGRKLESALEDLPRRMSERTQDENIFRTRLNELGPGWDSGRLAGVDTSFQVRRHVQEMKRQMDTAGRRLELAENHITEVKSSVESAGQLLDVSRENLAKAGKIQSIDLGKVRQQQEALSALSTALHKKDLQIGRLESQETRYSDLLQQAERDKTSARNIQPVPLWALFIPLVLGLILSGWLAVQNMVPLAVIAFLFGAGISFLLYIVRRRSPAGNILSPDKSGREQDRTELGREIEALKSDIAVKEKNIENIARNAGLDIPQDMDHLQQMALQAGKLADRLREQARLEESVRTSESQWKRQAEKLNQAEKELSGSREEVRRLDDEWQAWLHERGFDIKIRPEGFDTILQIIEGARTAEANLNTVDQRIKEMSQYIEDVRARVREALSSCGEAQITREIGVEDIDHLKHSLEKALAAQRQQHELQEKIESLKKEIEDSRLEMTGIQAEIDDLFFKSACQNEDEFRAKSAAFIEWENYHQKFEEDNLALLTIAGTHESQEELQKELSETAVLQLQEEEHKLRLQADEINKVIAQNHQEIGNLNGKIEQMEMDQDLGELLLAKSNLEEQLHQNLKRWAALAVCGSLLESTLKIYERDRQPDLIKEADRFLGVMTDSRYHLFSPSGGSDIQLEDNSLSRKSEPSWSSGLADQVYLAVRLSMAHEFGKRNEPIPVILDDVLVNFDPGRQLGASRVILEFAAHQQVMLFSCHPEIIDIFNEASQGLPPSNRIKRFTITGGKIKNT